MPIDISKSNKSDSQSDSGSDDSSDNEATTTTRHSAAKLSVDKPTTSTPVRGVAPRGDDVPRGGDDRKRSNEFDYKSYDATLKWLTRAVTRALLPRVAAAAAGADVASEPMEYVLDGLIPADPNYPLVWTNPTVGKFAPLRRLSDDEPVTAVVYLRKNGFFRAVRVWRAGIDISSFGLPFKFSVKYNLDSETHHYRDTTLKLHTLTCECDEKCHSAGPHRRGGDHRDDDRRGDDRRGDDRRGSDRRGDDRRGDDRRGSDRRGSDRRGGDRRGGDRRGDDRRGGDRRDDDRRDDDRRPRFDDRRGGGDRRPRFDDRRGGGDRRPPTTHTDGTSYTRRQDAHTGSTSRQSTRRD